MTRFLRVLEAGPGCQVQDAGREGYYRFGVPEGGVMDRAALYENAALLSQPVACAVLEMAGLGGRFEVLGGPLRLALTGAPMRAKIDGVALEWNATAWLEPGQVLEIGAAETGVYGYLGVGGGFAVAASLGSRATLVRAGIGGFFGRALAGGDPLPLGPDDAADTQLRLEAQERFGGGNIRVLWGPQSGMFSSSERDRFANIEYCVDHRANRMGVRLQTDEPPLRAEGHLSNVSDAVSLGDVQIPGDGYPAVLLADRQTTGGYPRIATIIQADLARMVQARPGESICFKPVSLDEALAALAGQQQRWQGLAGQVTQRLRDPFTMHDLLDYELASGAIAGEQLPWE